MKFDSNALELSDFDEAHLTTKFELIRCFPLLLACIFIILVLNKPCNNK